MSFLHDMIPLHSVLPVTLLFLVTLFCFFTLFFHSPCHQRTGREVNLKYVDEADLATNKIRVVPKEERETDPGSGSGPDAEDLMVLKRKVRTPHIHRTYTFPPDKIQFLFIFLTFLTAIDQHI